MTLSAVFCINAPFSIANVVSYIGEILTADRKKVPEKQELLVIIHLVLQSSARVKDSCGSPLLRARIYRGSENSKNFNMEWTSNFIRNRVSRDVQAYQIFS